MTGYLDTNLLSGLVKDDIDATELIALRELLRLRRAGAIDLCTSHITREELEKLPPGARAHHEDIYFLLDDVPIAGEHIVVGMLGTAVYGSVPYGGVLHIEDADLSLLRSIVPDRDDARHLFQAIRGGHVDYFITADKKTIVRFAAEIEAAFPLLVRTPSQTIAELESASPAT